MALRHTMLNLASGQLGKLSRLARQQPRSPNPEVVLDDVQMLNRYACLGLLLPVVLRLSLRLRHRRSETVGLLVDVATTGLHEHVLHPG